MEIKQSITIEFSWVIDYTKYKANNPKMRKSIDHKPLTCGERIKKRAFKVKIIFLKQIKYTFTVTPKLKYNRIGVRENAIILKL